MLKTFGAIQKDKTCIHKPCNLTFFPVRKLPNGFKGEKKWCFSFIAQLLYFIICPCSLLHKLYYIFFWLMKILAKNISALQFFFLTQSLQLESKKWPPPIFFTHRKKILKNYIYMCVCMYACIENHKKVVVFGNIWP